MGQSAWRIICATRKIYFREKTGTHDQSADEQLTNLQKRIFLIEFLRLGLFIVYQEKSYLIQLFIITSP